MYEALVARVRYHIQKANFMGLKDAESTLLLGEAADAIEQLSRAADAIPHVCECCIGCEVESGCGCDSACFVLSPKRAREYLSKPRWIPVAERLPGYEYGESTSVLTVDLYGVMRVTYFDGGNWCWPSGEALTTMRVAPITHWMPLPKAPEEE